MNNPNLISEPTFEDELKRLSSAMSLTVKWNAPAIFLAIYDSAALGTQAFSTLESQLNRQGQQVKYITPDVDGKNHLIDEVFGKFDWDKTVFFIMHFNFSNDADLYEMLNTQSDFLVNNHLRVLYWVTEESLLEYIEKAPSDNETQYMVFDFSKKIPWKNIWTRIAPKTWSGVRDFTNYDEDYFSQTAPSEMIALDLKKDITGLQKRARLLWKLALFYFQQNRYKKATIFAEKATKVSKLLQSKTLKNECRLVNLLIKSRKPEESENFSLSLKTQECDFTENSVWNNLGDLYAALFLSDEALTAYERVLNHDRTNAKSWCGLGEAYLAQNDLEKSIDRFQKAIELSPNFARAWRGLGYAYSRLNSYPKALEAYLRSVSIDAFQRDLWIEISHLAETNLALHAIEHVIDLDPTEASIWNLQGNLQYALGKNSNAIRSYYQAIDLDKTFGWAYANMGLVYYKQKSYDKAIILFLKSIQNLPSNKEKAHVYHRLGNTYRAADKFASSVKSYKEAEKLFTNRSKLEKNSDLPGPLSFEWEIARKWKPATNEKTSAKKTMRISTKKVDEIQDRKSKLSRSIVLKKVLKNNQHAQKIEYWLELGAFYIRNHMYELAEEAFQIAIDLEPDNGMPYYKLGIAYTFTGLYREAVPLYEKSILLFRQSKDKALSWNQLGNTYRRLNEHSLAVAAYEQARTLAPVKNSMLLRARQSLLSNCYSK